MLLALVQVPPFATVYEIPLRWVAVAAAAAGLCLLIALFLWGIRNPVVWRLLSALGMAAGSGLLVWGIVAAATGEPAPFDSPAGTIGAGVGTLVGSITLLVVSFLGGRPRQG